MAAAPWKVSLHGGHSAAFCEHATGSLREILQAALSHGFDTFGITEHAPRTEARFLYASERAKGYSVTRLQQEFERYAAASASLQEEFRGRLRVLRGFEAEIVPTSSYAASTLSLRKRFAFDYIVGSVHYVEEISIDESQATHRCAVEACGGLEPFLVRYYRLVRRMIADLRPEVVGHLDLPRLHAPPGADLATARIRAAAALAIEEARAQGCILDLNTAAWRKGLSCPYPAPWLVRMAAEAGVPFCFGDDSHDPLQVGFGLDRARRYLLANGVSCITSLRKRDGLLERREVPLV